MTRRVELKDVAQWGNKHSRIFERQEALFYYLDSLRGRRGAENLRGFSVESEENLVGRLRRGAAVKLFGNPEEQREAAIVPQRRFFVAATYEDIYRYLFDTEEVEDDDLEVDINLDGSTTVRSKPELTTQQLQLASIYEIIREGTPCRLYFDIEVEYDKVDSDPPPAAPEEEDISSCFERSKLAYFKYCKGAQCEAECKVAFDPAETTTVLLEELDAALNDEYQIHIRKEDVVKLISKYPHKYSCHYIIHLPGCAFKSNQHMGRFLTTFVRTLYKKAASDERLHRSLFYHKVDDGVEAGRAVLASGFLDREDVELSKPLAERAVRGGLNFKRSLTPVIDLAVYTRNRTFRCMSASKLGKKSHLHLDASDCSYPFFTDYQLFLASLVANVDAVQDGQPVRMLEYGVDDVKRKGSTHLPGAVGTGITGAGSSGAVARTGASPLPLLDAYIGRVLKKSPYGTGVIAKYLLYDTTILYTVHGSRYCHNVGRQHRSNGVYIVVSFARECYRQKCYDLDCRGYASPDMSIDDPAVVQEIRKHYYDNIPPPQPVSQPQQHPPQPVPPSQNPAPPPLPPLSVLPPRSFTPVARELATANATPAPQITMSAPRTTGPAPQAAMSAPRTGPAPQIAMSAPRTTGPAPQTAISAPRTTGPAAQTAGFALRAVRMSWSRPAKVAPLVAPRSTSSAATTSSRGGFLSRAAAYSPQAMLGCVLDPMPQARCTMQVPPSVLRAVSHTAALPVTPARQQPPPQRLKQSTKRALTSEQRTMPLVSRVSACSPQPAVQQPLEPCIPPHSTTEHPPNVKKAKLVHASSPPKPPRPAFKVRMKVSRPRRTV